MMVAKNSAEIVVPDLSQYSRKKLTHKITSTTEALPPLLLTILKRLKDNASVSPSNPDNVDGPASATEPACQTAKDLVEISNQEFHCCLQETRRIYIPLNPYSYEESELHKSVGRCGLPYYVFSKVSEIETHTFEDGSEIPEYRWNLRKWLFKRYDEGVLLDADGFTEVTPEEVAIHIARTMRAFTETEDGVPKEKDVSCDDSKQCDSDNGNLCEGRVLEACCGYGGNTIQLAKQFTSVTGIDLSEERLNQAKQNAKLYGTESRVRFDKADICSWCSAYKPCTPSRCNDAVLPAADDTVVTATEQEEFLSDSKPAAQTPMSHTSTVMATEKIVTDSTEKKSQIIPPKMTLMEQAIHDAEENPFIWGFISPPWGGEGYRKQDVFDMRSSGGVDSYKMILEMGRITQNIAAYLPKNQDMHQIAELAQNLPHCACTVIEDIFIGLSRNTKYKVVYFLSEKTARNAIAGFDESVANLLLVELDESAFVKSSFRFLLEKMNSQAIMDCLAATCAVCAAGGLTKTEKPKESRTKGGVFFQIIKERYISVYRELNKFKKAEKLARITKYIEIKKNKDEMKKFKLEFNQITHPTSLTAL